MENWSKKDRGRSYGATELRSYGATELRSDEATKRRSDEATEKASSDASTARRLNEVSARNYFAAKVRLRKLDDFLSRATEGSEGRSGG
jgi:hypothetical protein